MRITGAQPYSSDGSTNDAKVTDNGELLITEAEREQNVWARYEETGITSTRYAVLVDLSDTTNWKHNDTGRIDLSMLSFSIDRNGAATGALQIGVITRIDGTSSDISYFHSILFSNADDKKIIYDVNYAPSQIRLGQTSGVVRQGITNVKETNVTAVKTGTNLNSPNGTSSVNPAVGDLVIKMTRDAGTYGISVLVLYHAEQAP